MDKERIVCLLRTGPHLVIVEVIEGPMFRLTGERGGERKEAGENGKRPAPKAHPVLQHDVRSR